MFDASGLKNSGLKVTFPRMKILEIFSNSEVRHLSAEQVYRALVAENIEMGLATVYRVLTQFEQCDLLKCSQFGGKQKVYELNDGEEHHGHLVCTQTGTVQEFYDPQIEKRLQKMAADMGYTLSEYSITLFGEKKKKGDFSHA